MSRVSIAETARCHAEAIIQLTIVRYRMRYCRTLACDSYRLHKCCCWQIWLAV